MGEAAGDVVTVQTRHGSAKATRMGVAESGSSRWQIEYGWGAEIFFGTSAEVLAHMQKELAGHAAESESS